MVNPGSPEQMQAMQQNMPPMSKNSMIGLLLSLVVMMAVMTFRVQIGEALNHVFFVFDFEGKWPVLTLVIAGLIMITMSTVVRGLITDPIAQAKSQAEKTALDVEMRQARQENNLYKLKKFQEQKQEMMIKNMKSTTDQMKAMPLTVVIIMPVFAWISYFVSNTVPDANLYINMPWGILNLMDNAWIMPYWIIIYTMISLPIGQLENRFVRFYFLKKRLMELDAVAQ